MFTSEVQSIHVLEGQCSVYEALQRIVPLIINPARIYTLNGIDNLN